MQCNIILKHDALWMLALLSRQLQVKMEMKTVLKLTKLK